LYFTKLQIIIPLLIIRVKLPHPLKWRWCVVYSLTF